MVAATRVVRVAAAIVAAAASLACQFGSFGLVIADGQPDFF